MTKAAAIHSFWNSFGIPFFEEHSVKSGSDAPAFPYGTYELVTDSFGTTVALTASLWYRTSSWIEPNKKSEEISDQIGRGGVYLNCDGGAIYVTRGTPFSQSMGDESDDRIKRKLMNINVEYLTEN